MESFGHVKRGHTRSEPLPARWPLLEPRSLALTNNSSVDMLRTALKAGVGRLPRRAVNGGGASTAYAGRRAMSSLEEALVKVTFVDAEVRLC